MVGGAKRVRGHLFFPSVSQMSSSKMAESVSMVPSEVTR